MVLEKLHYEDYGDNYETKDPFKIWALEQALTTSHNLERFPRYGMEALEVRRSRGESAYRIRFKSSGPIDFEIAAVEEGIGTKNVVADDLAEIYQETFYESSGYDNVAAVVNDLATTAAAPAYFLLHVAAWPPEWFENELRAKAFFRGTAHGCNDAGASWGGGESATMRDIIMPGRSLLSGSTLGLIIPSDKALEEERIAAGDRILFLPGTGVHTNGITSLRIKEMLDRLPQSYQTKLPDGTTYGQALLQPSAIYSRLMEELVQQTEVHYAVNITGHGLRKLMRPLHPYTYRVEQLPTPQPIFSTIQKYCALSDREMYEIYNMGAGFAVYLPPKSVDKAMEICEQFSKPALDAGEIKEGPKRVIINPIGQSYEADSLQIR